MRVLAKWETLDLQVPQVTYGEGGAVIWIDNYCSEVTASGFLPGALPAMVRWDLQVLLVSKVLLGCQGILGQRIVMDNAVLETA